MAKSTNTKAAAASPARADVARLPKVAEALKGVRQFYAVGRGKDSAPAHWNNQMRLEAKKFAGKYSAEELRTLWADAERHNFTLCVSHVRCLLPVEGDDHREKFVRALIAGRWGKLRLDAEIRRRLGNRRQRGGGRKPVPPADAAGAYIEVIRACDRWCRFYGALGGPSTSDTSGSPGRARAASRLWRKLSPAVREAAEAAGEAMRRLNDAAEKADEPRRAKLPGGVRPAGKLPPTKPPPRWKGGPACRRSRQEPAGRWP